MRIIVYDIEVFKYDWVVVYYDLSANSWTVIHNDNKAVRQFMTQPNVIFCGFNNKSYDNQVVKAMACGASPELVKQINDFIIVDNRNGWEHWFLKKHRFWFDSFDLMDDTQQGTSLKHIEAHQGEDIEQSEVDFSINRPLTAKELELTIAYCKWDVFQTAKLLTLRKNYLTTKLDVGRSLGLPDKKSLYMTNALLTATALQAKATERTDERDYTYPDNLDKSLIPPEVLEFFDRIHDLRIPNEVYFKSSLTFKIGECTVKVGFGGLHAAIPNYISPKTGTRILRNFDVRSYYPSLMIENSYVSRNIPDPKIFEKVYWDRVAAKEAGDKTKANALKLILNTTYGASLASTNPLYDPLMGRSVCISGQLYLMELAIRLYNNVPGLRIVQLNTDGITLEFEESQYPEVYAILDEWQQRTRFVLEEDKIQTLVQKDVNNYFLMFESGKSKTKGAYFSMGISQAGAFSINNNFLVVKRALRDFFLYGTPVENTILDCNRLKDFMIIAKAGSDYKSVYRVPGNYDEIKKKWQKENRILTKEYVGKSGKIRREYKDPPFRWENYTGQYREVQRVNRVYAAINPNMGTLVKVKPDGTVGRIQGLPDSCIIDNKNKRSIDVVDKQWYINLAKKYIDDYVGKARGKSRSNQAETEDGEV